MKLTNTPLEVVAHDTHPILMVIINPSGWPMCCHSTVGKALGKALKHGRADVSKSAPEIRPIMIAKLFYLWFSLAKFSLEQLFIQFDLYDVAHILFLGALGVCLRIFDQRQRNAFKTVRSSLRSPASPGKKRGSVSFAAGTKFYPIQSYTPVG